MGIFQVQYDCRYHGSRIGSPMIQLSFPFAVCQRQGHIHCRGYFIGRTDRDFVQRVPSCRGSIALCRFKFDDFLPHHLFPVTGCDPQFSDLISLTTMESFHPPSWVLIMDDTPLPVRVPAVSAACRLLLSIKRVGGSCRKSW